MSGFGEPEWVNPSNANANDTTEEAATGGNITAPPPNPATDGPAGKVRAGLMGLSILCLGLSAMMVALGVLTIIEVHENGFAELTEPLLAFYMILFATLLFMYELMWWYPLPKVNKGIRRNFGFMYGMRGKGLYLIFVACLCFGLGKDASVKILNWATGISFLAIGCLHWFVICFHPDMAKYYIAPTVGLTDDDDEKKGEQQDENVV